MLANCVNSEANVKWRLQLIIENVPFTRWNNVKLTVIPLKLLVLLLVLVTYSVVVVGFLFPFSWAFLLFLVWGNLFLLLLCFFLHLLQLLWLLRIGRLSCLVYRLCVKGTLRRRPQLRQPLSDKTWNVRVQI